MRKKVALLAGIATLAMTGTAIAGAGAYLTGIYSGGTTQGHGIAMDVGRGFMKEMAYFANYRCADKAGDQFTLKNHKQKLGRATISNDQINAVYNNGSNTVHLFVALHNGSAKGWFKQAFFVFHNGKKLLCVTPGGQATTAGKVFFKMSHQ